MPRRGSRVRISSSAPFYSAHSVQRSILSTSTLNRLAPTQVELEIPITTDQLAAAEERAFKRLVKKARLPGFRPGKIPRKVFEQAYGSDAITSQAMEEVLPDAYAQAVREHDLDPVDRPRMEVVEESEGRPTRLKATVEVRPQIELGSYKGLAVGRPPVTVGDDDVERSLAALAKDRATLVPVERPAQLGDVVTIDYAGSIDGEAFDGGTAENQVTELSGDRFIPGFVDGIAGLTSGETKDVEARFPDDYAEQSLAGKTATFRVKLHDVKQLEPPPIDDEFAKSVSKNETLEALREDVRRRLEAIAESRGRRVVGNAIVEKLLASHDFPLPPSLVDAEVEHLMSDVAGTAGRSGKTLQEYLSEGGKTEDQLRAELRTEAEGRVKTTLLIERIAKIERIAATPADVTQELEALSRQYGQPVARIRKALGNSLLSLMDGIVRNKTLDFLIDNAEVTEETPSPAS
ncbi:MAG TPA: trigger factor [Candidatus Baltobacteraceae bacterium]|nr:trigger factor [Candidatus Baltobacteraceae bacterium]